MRVTVYAQLQQLDRQLADLLQRRAELETELRAGGAVHALYEQRRELSGRLKLERGQASDLHWELDELETRLRELMATEREGPNDPLAARELALLREQRNQLEDRVLEQMEHVDRVARELAEADTLWRERSLEWATREPALREELDALMAKLERLQADRQRIGSTISPEARALYEDLQRRHRGSAITSVRNRACGACRARLPAAVFDLLAGLDPLVRCPRCGRVFASIEPSEGMLDDGSDSEPCDGSD